MVKRNVESIAVLTGDKGYDDQKLRRLPATAIFGHSSSIGSLPQSTKRGMHASIPTSTINEIRMRR